MSQWTVTEYDEDQDLHHINTWLRDRKHPEIDPYDIPEIGYVANFKNRPIACGFLRALEGEDAMFDGLASNPIATSEFRHIALDMVMNAIIDKAKSKGIGKILGFTVDVGTLERAIRHNFVKLPHTFVTLDLKNGPSH